MGVGYCASVLRRLTLATALFALAMATSASASFQPVRRDYRESPLPRVRKGTIKIPAGHASGLTRVIVRLSGAPLAAWNSQRGLASASHVTRLDVHSAAAKVYLARLARAQQVAVAELHAAIPQARVQERYRIVFDGFAVELPYNKLPNLVRLGFAAKVYPSLSYYATVDRGPSVIHATDYTTATGDAGQGIKIGVVDTGVDSTNPYLDPAGFSYPPGFPKGDKALTTPKVIVARDFPGPGSGAAGRKAFDSSEPHGTHVAGIAAGDAGTTAPAGPDHPQAVGLSGVAPKAWIGNYRVFNVPTPLGDEADTPEIIEAFEAAVADGMNVINFSGGGPQTDPANDAMYVAVHNTVLAGVVPVIAAGNDREDFGLGSTGSPGTAPDAITVAATSNTNVFAPALTVTGGPPSLGAVPIQTRRLASAGDLVDGRSDGRRRRDDHRDRPQAGRRAPLRDGGRPQRHASARCRPAPSRARSPWFSRGTCSFVSKAERAQLAGAIGIIFIDNRFGEANPLPEAMPIPGRDDRRPRRAEPAHLRGRERRLRDDPGVAQHRGDPDRPERRDHQLLVGRADRLRARVEARHLGSGARRALVDAAGHDRLDVLGLRRHVDGDTARRGRGGAAPAAPSGLGALAGQVGADGNRRPCLGEHRPDAGGVGAARGRRARQRRSPRTTRRSSPRRSRCRSGTSTSPTARRPRRRLLTLSDAGDGSGSWAVTLAAAVGHDRCDGRRSGSATIAPGGDVSIPVVVHAAADAVTGENDGFVVLTQNGVVRRVPYAVPGRAPRARERACGEAQADPDRQHGDRHEQGLGRTAARRRRSASRRTTPARR